jgi:hypothetical protein
MEFSKQQIQDAMDNYQDDNDAFGDINESKLIIEVFTGFKSLLLENTSNKVSTKLLQEHANTLTGVNKDVFEDFVLYLQMTEINSRLL